MTIADLAARARQLAAKLPAGTPDRQAWGCAAMALSATASFAAARRTLASIHDPELRAAATEALNQIASQEAPR
jgi:hypothetical protein